jgi:hypothetical protein
MGMDTVELVMRIEEEFGIDLPDEELQAIKTVGDLYRLVLMKLETGSSQRLSNAYYRLRRAMIACLGLQRSSIHPSTKLRPLLPKPTRAAAWKCLAEVSDLAFPKLRHPRWARDAIRGLTAVAVLAFFAAMVLWSHPWGLFWLPLVGTTAIIGVMTMAGLYAATPFLARELPVRTVGELAKQLLGMNLAKLGPEEGGGEPPAKGDVWQRIVFLFCDQMQLDWEQITPEARISEDLLID